MKLITALALFALSLTSCVTTETPFADIKGRYIGEKEGKEIHLCKVEHGKTSKVAVTKIGKDGYFGFYYAVDTPGLYVVNVVWDTSLKTVNKEHDLKRVYLEKGTEIEIEISDGKYKLVNTNSKKNRLLSEWNTQIDTVFTYSHGFSYSVINYETFFPLLSGFVEKANEFKKSINTGDKGFDELMQLMVETDMNLTALNFVFTPRTKHPTKDMYPEYYSYILKDRAPQNGRLLELANGYNYIREYTMYAVMSSPKKPDRSEWQKVAISNIPNNLLKGYYAYEVIKGFRAYDSRYIEFKEVIQPYLLNDYLKDGVNAYEMSIRKIGAGSPAIDFTGTDVNGKEHKLSDYKGTVVYVDVWATWCGPCKAQIPALKELEKKFHGKSITFISISVDKEKDRKKWQDYVKNENLKGVQIMADKAFDSDVTKAYKINAIPRFMIFDKKGNIVTTDAPRPSNIETEDVLRKLL